MALHKVNPR